MRQRISAVASSKRHAIPGCQTSRISKPACFLGQSEGVTSDREAHHGTNGWLYCASIEPETAEEQAAWRKASPAGRDAVSPIRRPRAFSRALGAMAAQQAGPRGRIVLLRNTVDGRTFCTAHKSQTVYHGPVVSADAPVRRLETASSDLETGHPTTNVGFHRNSAAEAQQSWPHNRCN